MNCTRTDGIIRLTPDITQPGGATTWIGPGSWSSRLPCMCLVVCRQIPRASTGLSPQVLPRSAVLTAAPAPERRQNCSTLTTLRLGFEQSPITSLADVAADPEESEFGHWSHFAAAYPQFSGPGGVRHSPITSTQTFTSADDVRGTTTSPDLPSDHLRSTSTPGRSESKREVRRFRGASSGWTGTPASRSSPWLLQYYQVRSRHERRSV